jgi:hypothetical protein
MAFSLTSISPQKASCEGGVTLTITGTFELTHRYRVHIGNSETTGDPICYSGIAGQGNVVYPTNATTLIVYTPLLVSSATPYSVLVVDLDTTEIHVLLNSFTALKKQFYSLVYRYRKNMHPDYKVGPRNIELEAPV